MVEMPTGLHSDTPQGRGRGGGASSQKTKDALVAAAAATLAERGYAGTSARRIAARAECNQALVFYHFGSVDDLLLTVLDTVSARRMATLGARVDEAATLSALLDVLQDMVTGDPRNGDLAVLVALIDAGRGNPGLAHAVGERLRPWQQFTEQTIHRFAAMHPLGMLIPVPAVARMTMATVLGLELLGIPTDHDPAPVTDLIGQLRTLAAVADIAGPQYPKRS
ncbi:TetR/AcrR family transcriptional regulator [Leekyejoonella antrihumi]|uniref:TetR/AcrR family transcriptional regulator n=1 Tax=Leekyejoonella antrihumi TaxID=1660198 RepID=UPI001C94050A|nr:TetR/AcrR family transcriptional regulator [Leekyejoonella antrihumi]